jgi:hypothetical protein
MAEPDVVRGQFSVDPMTGVETPSSDAVPHGLDSLLSSSRLTYPGDGLLPVDDVPLEGMDDTDALPQGTTEALPAEAGTPPPATLPDPERDALLARLNALEADLATLRTPSTRMAPEPVTATPEPWDATPLVEKAKGRFAQLFTEVEGLDPADPQYNTARAERFARSIIDSVVEDILGDPRVVQSRVQPILEPGVTARAREVVQQDRIARTEQDALATAIQRAVQVGREAGYDIHPPGSPQHLQSSESRLFWGAATQVPQDIPLDEQITQTLALLPAKAPPRPGTEGPPSSTGPGSAPVRQPMGRQGMGRTAGPQPGPADETYQPKKLGDMLNETRQLRVVA